MVPIESNLERGKRQSRIEGTTISFAFVVSSTSVPNGHSVRPSTPTISRGEIDVYDVELRSAEVSFVHNEP